MSEIQERPLTEQEKSEFQLRADQARRNLGVSSPDTPPETLLQAVETFVDQWQDERRNPLKSLFKKRGASPDPIEVALGLGAVWGDVLVRRFGWEWTCVLEEGKEWYGVASPDRALVIYPTYFLKACLDTPNADCTAMLVFNMLVAGKISGMPAQGYENVMSGVRRIIPKR